MCNKCKHSKIQTSFINGKIDLDFDKPLFCTKHKQEVEDNHKCKDYKADKKVAKDIQDGLW